MLRYKMTFQQDNNLAFPYTLKLIYLRATASIIYFSSQQFSIVLIILFVVTFSPEVTFKRINIIVYKHCASTTATRYMHNFTI